MSMQQPVGDEKAGMPLSIRVPRDALYNSSNAGLQKAGWTVRTLSYLPGVDKTRVLVTGSHASHEDTALYVADTLPGTNGSIAPTPTEKIHVHRDQHPDIVYRGDQFEASFMGMSASSFDCGKNNNNELLLYSLIRESLCDDIETERHHDHNVRSTRSSSAESATVPTGISNSADVPFIHYDPVVDGHDRGTEPNSYVPIPASKRLYYRHTHRETERHDLQQVFNVRFTMKEIDKVSDLLARAPATIDQLGSYVSKTAGSVSHIAVITKALSFANEIGKYGIKNYAKPDHILSQDAEFPLAERDQEGSEEGDYLRYGYYFFLSKPVDAQLYAQTRSSAQFIPLMLKREDITRKKRSKHQTEYFPLTGVSYVVMKVSRRCTNHGFGRSQIVRSKHRQRLEHMLEMKDVMEMMTDKRSRRAKLRRMVGR